MTRIGTLCITLTSWIVFGISFATAAMRTTVDCPPGVIGGKITFVQTNGFRADFDFTPRGSELQGSGSYVWVSGDQAFTITGPVLGRVDGNYFEFTVYWNNATTGVYAGHLDPQGRMEGSSYDKQNPGSMAMWHSEGKLQCPGIPSRFEGSVSPGSSMKNDASPKTAFVAFCKDYASKAVAAAKVSVQLSCEGNEGPRWSDNFNDHLDWCMALNGDQGPPNTETAARASALQSCREQIARRGEIVQKPNIPTGDLTKPVTPPPSEPLPPGGTGNFLKQMKP
jgi:hypothetical protein